MKTFAVLSTFLLAGTTLGQTQIPIPAFQRTFSVTTATRGLYFQAPIDFKIVGLRVPDETGAGVQNCEVFLMQNAPPAFSASATGGQVFYSVGQPSSQIIPCNISVTSGEYVGVLGACGSSTMHSSYGTADPFPSDVLGAPTALYRFLTQTNLVTSGGNQPYSAEPGGPVGRVEIYVAPACNGTVTAAGAGCLDSGGTQNRMAYSGCPDLGAMLTLEHRASATAVGSSFMVLGLSDSIWLAFLLPIDLTPFGAAGCSVYTSHETILGPLPFTSGSAGFSATIPNSGFLSGATFHVQGYHLDPGVNPLNVALTDYLTITIS